VAALLGRVLVGGPQRDSVELARADGVVAEHSSSYRILAAWEVEEPPT
jgi:hypothetical protein